MEEPDKDEATATQLGQQDTQRKEQVKGNDLYDKQPEKGGLHASHTEEIISPKNEKDICEPCEKEVVSGQEGLQCQFCGKWYHGPCPNVKSDDYKGIQRLKGVAAVLWPCQKCRVEEKTSEKQRKELERKNNELKKKIEKLSEEAKKNTSLIKNSKNMEKELAKLQEKQEKRTENPQCSQATLLKEKEIENQQLKDKINELQQTDLPHKVY